MDAASNLFLNGHDAVLAPGKSIAYCALVSGTGLRDSGFCWLACDGHVGTVGN